MKIFDPIVNISSQLKKDNFLIIYNMSSSVHCHPASISLREYVELFLQTQKGSGNGNAAGKLVVKCNLTHSGTVRFVAEIL